MPSKLRISLTPAQTARLQEVMTTLVPLVPEHADTFRAIEYACAKEIARRARLKGARAKEAKCGVCKEAVDGDAAGTDGPGGGSEHHDRQA